MEQIYASKFKEDGFFSRKFTVGKSLLDYSVALGFLKIDRKQRRSLELLTGYNREELQQFEKLCDPRRLWCKDVKPPVIPDRGYNPKFALSNYEGDTGLEVMKYNNISEKCITGKRGKPRKEEFEKTAVDTNYRGEIEIDARNRRESDKGRGRTLFKKMDGLLNVQIRSKLKEGEYAVTQELLVPTSLTLDRLKDRILCREDFQPAFPTVTSCSDIKLDVNKFCMLFINERFYIDGRWGEGDYGEQCETIVRWAETRNLDMQASYHTMETTKFDDMIIRLGYPYLYVHHGFCEHLIVFTDSRLVNSSDLPYLEDYPLMLSYGNLPGLHCLLCSFRIAKWIISECDLIPYEIGCFCNLCYLSYLFDSEGYRKTTFNAYKYVDCKALL